MSANKSATGGLAGRYAAALFDLAESEKSIDAVTADLDQLSAMMAESDDLNRLLRSPVISRQDKVRAMAALAEKAGFNDLTGRFIGVVADNQRLFVLADIISVYRDILSAHRGEATAEVVSASKLSDTQLKALGDQLKKAVGTKVAVDASVDPDLLGGLVVKVGSRMIDSSLRTKLQQLRLSMIGIG